MNGIELLKQARKSPNYAGERQCGSHIIIKSKNGRIAVYPNHGAHDIPPGTLHSIKKQMLAALLLMLALAFGISQLLPIA